MVHAMLAPARMLAYTASSPLQPLRKPRLATHAAGLSAAEALALLVPIVRQAGEIGLGFVKSGAKAFVKKDASPVTEADLAINRFLSEHLRGLSPAIGWLSEEDGDDGERLKHRQVFILDPIDGTRGFIAGNGEWAVSVGLVEDGRPLAGVLYRPTTDELFAAARGIGATRNGERLAVTSGPAEATATIAGPKPVVDLLQGDLPQIRRLPSLASLALRLAAVAEGKCDAALAKPNACDWDIAAVDIILSEAGGRLTTLDGADIAYNQPVPRHRTLVAAGLARQDGLTALLRARLPHGS